MRLARLGRKKHPFYRIMISDSRAPRDGRHIDAIGFVDPLKNPRAVTIDREKALYWLNKGAIPTQTVKNILSSEGILLEWDLRKSDKSDEFITSELQKFSLLQDLKKKNKEEKQKVTEKVEVKSTETKEKEAESGAPSLSVSSDTEQTVPE